MNSSHCHLVVGQLRDEPLAKARFDYALDEFVLQAEQNGIPTPIKQSLAPLRVKAPKIMAMSPLSVESLNHPALSKCHNRYKLRLLGEK